MYRLADQKQDDLQTSRQEIDKLLEEWDKSKSRTQETLFRLHAPFPTYRMLTQQDYHYSGTGSFDPTSYYTNTNYAYLSLTGDANHLNCDGPIVGHQSKVTDSPKNPIFTSPIETTADSVPPTNESSSVNTTTQSTSSQLPVDKELKSEYNYSQSVINFVEGSEESEITDESSNNTLSSILKTWFLKNNPTPVLSCKCLDECLCCKINCR